MSTSTITRMEVSFYMVTKNKGDKDSLKVKFRNLSEAREYARGIRMFGNFKSLTNSNGTILPI